MDSARHTELLKRMTSTLNSAWVIDPPTAVKDNAPWSGVASQTRVEFHHTCGDYSILFFFLLFFFFSPGRGIGDFWIYCSMTGLLIFTVYGISQEAQGGLSASSSRQISALTHRFGIQSTYNSVYYYTINGVKTPASV